jgi:uncharacterized membrane protein YedE/YeeE
MGILTAFLSGVIFALGLGISGMTRPGTVLAFLDVAGAWDPSLAFVMLGAIGTHALLLRAILARRTPVLAPRFALPTRREIDGRLVGGAALFGIGWGLAGFCPGPAITSLVGGRVEPLVFVAAMLGGMLLYERVLATVSGAAPAVDTATERQLAPDARHLNPMERSRS